MALTLATTVEAALGANLMANAATWTWTDLGNDSATGQSRLKGSISATRGRPDDSSETDATVCGLRLSNVDGWLTPRHPSSPWYGLWGLGTPIRVTMLTSLNFAGADAFGRTVSSGWGTADSGGAWTTVGGSASDYSVGSGVGSISNGTVNVSRKTLLPGTMLDAEQVISVSTPVTATGAAIRTCLIFRYIDVNNYYRLVVSFDLAGAISVRFIKRLGGTETNPVAKFPAAVASYVTGTLYRIRAQVVGTAVRMRVWPAAGTEPSTWDLETTDGDLTTAGQVGVHEQLQSGNTNTLPVVLSHDNYAATDVGTIRAYGQVASIAPRWPAGNSLYGEVEVAVKGALWRLGQSSIPQSSLYRAVISSPSVIAYWPCEDADGSTQVASALAGIAAMTPAGAVDYAANSVIPGSKSLLTLAAGAQIQSQQFGQTSTNWQVDWHMYVPSTPGAEQTAVQWRMNGTAVLWRFSLTATLDTIHCTAVASDGTLLVDQTLTITAIGGLVGVWTHWHVTAQQSGGTVNVKITVFPSLGGNAFVLTPTYSGTIGNQFSYLTALAAVDGIGFGHIVVWDAYDYTEDGQAAFGHRNEAGGTRVTRVCGENGVPVTVVGTSTTTLGPQSLGAPLPVLREAESTDLGILTDGRHAGITYLSRESRYNQAVSLALDTAAQQVKLPFEPMEDDSRTVNRVTASRTTGSSATVADTTSIGSLGEYASAVTVNTYLDADLLDQAAWRVHLGTIPEMRAPTVTLQLIDRPELVAAVQALDIGERYTVANPPSQYPPGGLDLVLEQYAETWDATSWAVTLVGAPYQPWRVAVFAAESGDTSEYVWRLETDGSTLASSATTTATSLSVASTAAVWTTAADDLPFDVDIDGEQVRVTAVSGSSSPQTFTVTRSVNGVVKAHSSGAVVTLWRAPVIAL